MDSEGQDSSASKNSAFHPAHQTAQSSLGSVIKLIQEYEVFCDELASFKGSRSIFKDWDSDLCKLGSVFDKQRKVSKYNVHAHLETRNTTFEGSHADASLAAGEDVWKSFGGQTKMNDNENPSENWVLATRRAEKGVRHLVKGLQDDS